MFGGIPPPKGTQPCSYCIALVRAVSVVYETGCLLPNIKNEERRSRNTTAVVAIRLVQFIIV